MIASTHHFLTPHNKTTGTNVQYEVTVLVFSYVACATIMVCTVAVTIKLPWASDFTAEINDKVVTTLAIISRLIAPGATIEASFLRRPFEKT